LSQSLFLWPPILAQRNVWAASEAELIERSFPTPQICRSNRGHSSSINQLIIEKNKKHGMDSFIFMSSRLD